jgi:hypothetical protein
MLTKSEQEIERWKSIIASQGNKGIDRLRYYLVSVQMGSNFCESGDDYMHRIGLTAFKKWALSIVNPNHETPAWARKG